MRMLTVSAALKPLSRSWCCEQSAVPRFGLSCHGPSTSLLQLFQQTTSPRQEVCTRLLAAPLTTTSALTASMHSSFAAPRTAVTQNISRPLVLSKAADIILAAKSRSRRQILRSALGDVDSAVAELAAKRTSLDTCLHTVRELAAAQAATDAYMGSINKGQEAQQLEAAFTRWSEHLKRHTITEKDMWLYVQCGHWHSHPEGWTGPARAILQLWREADIVPESQSDVYDYTLWVLDDKGHLTGDLYVSGTALEGRTTRKGFKDYSNSVTVLEKVPEESEVSLGQCKGLKTLRKRAGRGNRQAFLFGKLMVRKRLQHWLESNLGITSLKRHRQNEHTVPVVSGDRQLKLKSRWRERSQKKAGSRKQQGLSSTTPDCRMHWKYISLTAQKAIATAAELAAADKLPRYIYPDAPKVQTTTLSLHDKDVRVYQNMLDDIANGDLHLARTHVQLADVLPAFKVLQSGALRESHINAADATIGRTATGARDPCDQLAMPEEPHIAAVGCTGYAMLSNVSSSRTISHRTAYTVTEAELTRQHQVYSLEDLHRRAREAELAQQQGLPLDSSQLPVVPDSTRPFTLTLTNGHDGQKYVVAHYEPAALKDEQQHLSAQLCAIFNNRRRDWKVQRVSAPLNEAMVMSGMRMPRRAGGPCTRYGRYHGDDDFESDLFAATAWPYLRTHGAFPAIGKFWTSELSRKLNEHNYQAAAQFGNRVGKYVGDANYPSPCLWGSPFTSLGITQNYHSKLHCEPGEHPFSFITWQDLLGPDSVMEVGYFWLTAGLAFLPLPGSALYIDVRLVTHRSEPCVVHNGSFAEEGRYGCALFIKPPVMKSNSTLWAQFDNMLQRRQLERAHVYSQLKAQKQAQQVEQHASAQHDMQPGMDWDASAQLQNKGTEQHSVVGLSDVNDSLDKVDDAEEQEADDVVLFGTLQHAMGANSVLGAVDMEHGVHGLLHHSSSVSALVSR